MNIISGVIFYALIQIGRDVRLWFFNPEISRESNPGYAHKHCRFAQERVHGKGFQKLLPGLWDPHEL